MSKIELKNIDFSYPGQLPLFQQVNVLLDGNWKIGLVGRNGRGKTTFLRILQRQLEAHGSIETSLDFVYFPLQLPDKSKSTLEALREILIFEQWQLERECTLLGVKLDVLGRPFESLSGGEQTKVLLACVFLEENNFPLIDEPTNHLDALGREKVADYLKKKKQGFILISHDRHFLDEVCNYILAIEKNQCHLQKGNYSQYHLQKVQEDKAEFENNAQLKSEISRLNIAAKEKERWSDKKEKEKIGAADKGFIGARSKRMMKRSKSLENRMKKEMEAKESLLKNVESIDELKLKPSENYHATYLIAENFSLSFDEVLFSCLNFSINKGDRVAITGENGIGKTTLLSAILGKFQGNIHGKLCLTNGVTISFVRQNYEENTGFLKDFAQKEQVDYTTFLSNLKKLGMERKTFAQKIETMSMGEKKKVELAKSLSQSCDLYIWDEPLNYLDIFNQEQIEKLVLQVKPTLLFIEHDVCFTEKIANKKVLLEAPFNHKNSSFRR